jgi:hypothetical protein
MADKKRVFISDARADHSESAAWGLKPPGCPDAWKSLKRLSHRARTSSEVSGFSVASGFKPGAAQNDN